MFWKWNVGNKNEKKQKTKECLALGLNDKCNNTGSLQAWAPDVLRDKKNPNNRWQKNFGVGAGASHAESLWKMLQKEPTTV